VSLENRRSASVRWDLHLHTRLSDGARVPEEVLALCAQGGLDVVALTDHDLGPSLPAGQHTFGEHTLDLLHGAEISVRYKEVELHMLVYFPSEMPLEFREFCTGQARGRANRYEYIREKLNLPGLPVATEEARSGKVSLTRFHLAQALVAAGHVGSVDEAFRGHLSRKRGLLPPLELTLEEGLERARASGGITSWAHPPLAWATEWARPLKKLGLHALEGVRPKMGAPKRRTMKKLAKKAGLALTGGSDWHGWGPESLGRFAVDGQQLSGFIRLLDAA